MDKFEKYGQMLIETNKKFNLTTIDEPDQIKIKHFEDSLTIKSYINEGMKVLDIGSGAGFPGIPLRIEKDFDLTLIDSVNKKVNFMNQVIEELDLKNTRAIHVRAEDFAKEHREEFDMVISRAVANLSTLSEYALPFLKVGGIFIAMKGPKAEEEYEDAKNALKILGGELINIDSMDLHGNTRKNILIKKVRSTKKKYPRGKNLPKKNPL
ncbi:16S rRNA (guanine(527)-N(7))-methyltransferase RsmG [Anaerococcus hydrogenalis]|uniref:Ribosomal RNA small subunit methyltransferase G n=3 Tax=Anaerococcus hydrogenalis TaxID=33029 RepID=F0GYU3_9FIRM|nr:16S rRNA (guanine(527)-N(7))-methyltransferase RsmG [Anaerococcus hydrogenalis]EEB35195.1 16S rRNA methyltransferase GidB [Anaerococcus hydrogenalis DSM 7454]EGC84614.1 16S rRNA (guanine(527)-N(7))-methyltransferase [Anaerococcus hydrogenalis ACS-025-V-Sch4]MBS5989300.1 16S rRNA (guanine(527)-N(7))-methyltransferase RsmG [Anaerococcus hydrogenalis]MDK7695538.1 16S rRNA (guanine(527)-N(7))-methyltransferase RsmG [Anaerococcus hydrogenalis]MDK7697232.1 16S rRNA (guanine(527)-N(7))-methyltrans